MSDPNDETVFYLCRRKHGAPGFHMTRMICPQVKNKRNLKNKKAIFCKYSIAS